MKKSLYILILFYSIIAISQQNSTPEQFVPKGWKTIKKETGDLNNDKLNDIVLIVEENNKDNFIKNQSLGNTTLNLNPRGIIILLKDKSSFTKVLENYSFIPSENDEESPCLADPLLEGGLDITNGVLTISLNYWYSCGSWFTNTNSYKFRYQENKFKMIGLDCSEMHRASGDATEISINFLTKKKKVTTGLSEFKESKPKVKWETIKLSHLYDLNISREIIIDLIQN